MKLRQETSHTVLK